MFAGVPFALSVMNSLDGEIVTECGVGEGDELSHDGDHGDDGFFTVGDEPFIEGSEPRIMLAGGKGGHKESALHLLPATSDAAITISASALVG